MFESLQENISSALRTLRGRGKLTEANMREGLALVQRALLEADVSLSVAKDFIARVAEQAVGEAVLKSLDPTQQLVGIVHQELVNLMGPVDHSLHLRGDLTVLMLCGLQGSGKTTTCGKLGRLIQQRRQEADARGRRLAAPRRHPAVAGHRPAARHARLRRPGGQGPGGPVPGGGQGRPRPTGVDVLDPRHGRPAARRRGVDGPVDADRPPRRARSRSTWWSTR